MFSAGNPSVVMMTTKLYVSVVNPCVVVRSATLGFASVSICTEGGVI